MKKLVVSVALASAVAFMYAPHARAEVFNVTPVVDPLGDCSGAENADECMAASPIKKCADMKVTGYVSCVAKCTCQYNENVKKCDGQQCRDSQKVDYDACQYQCQIDWV